MGSVVGDLLTSALGIALSPYAIVVAIMMMISPNAKGVSLAFLGGWLVGVIVPVVAFSLLVGLLSESATDGANPVAGTIRIVFGTLFVVFAAREWRNRPLPGKAAILPAWMTAVEDLSLGKGAALGFWLAALTPKNLVLAAAVGLTVGGAGLTLRASIVALLIYVLIGVTSILIAVVGSMITDDEMDPWLDQQRRWFARNGATILAVLYLVLGFGMIGVGIGSF